MPSKRTRLQYLLLKSIAWLAWVPLTGSLRHDRTVGDLKRLGPVEALGLAAPLCFYVAIAAYVYHIVPDYLIYWMAVSGGAVSALFLVVYFLTSLLNWGLDWRLYNSRDDAGPE
jgi:hypothetical protein